jgi:subtilisin family serine protease
LRRSRYVCSVLVTVVGVSCAKETREIVKTSAPENYIVVLKKSSIQSVKFKHDMSASEVVTSMVHSLADEYKIQVRRVYSVVLQGGVYEMTKDQAEALKQNPNIAYLEKDQIVRVRTMQSNVTWGLDRLDQASLPLDQKFNYPDSTARVNAYVIDTGILTGHQEFEGRASHGADLVDQDQDATDCNGHGTHVAGTIGGKNYGVAKNVKLYAVRVLDCQGSGTYSGVIAGIEWVTKNHVKPAVVNMSLGGPTSQAVDDAVIASIKAGVTYVLAAGNENTSACLSSPARVNQAITVGSTTNTDARSRRFPTSANAWMCLHREVTSSRRGIRH